MYKTVLFFNVSENYFSQAYREGYCLGKVVAIVNQKGGVGKTTTAVNLTAALGDRGAKCLLVDIDPQGNSTSGYGINKRTLTASAYELPTKESATKEAVIRLKDGQAHGDLMAANNSVTLAYGEENTLMLSLQRKVMMLESVTINNVPGSVTAVSVSVSPLHENILLDGSYSGESVSHTVALTREGVGNTWKRTSHIEIYLFISQ